MRFVALCAVALAGGCGDVSSISCPDGRLCPVGTTCEVDGDRCLVDEGGCADFDTNAPCVLGDGQGFCAASCEAPVRIIGKLEDPFNEDITKAQVVALERPWIDEVNVAIGSFTVNAAANDSDLLLRFTAEEFMPMLSRRLTIGANNFIFNGDAAEPLRMFRLENHETLVGIIGETYDPGNGLVTVRLQRPNESDLGNASVELVGASSPTPLYFAGPAEPDAALTATTSAAGRVIFPNVPPGDYEVVISHPVATRCRATGDVTDLPIRVTVEAGTSSTAAIVRCSMP